MAYCPQCGADVSDADFCPSCGAKVSGANPFAAGTQSQNNGASYYGGAAPDIPGFLGAWNICWKKAFNGKGRASRSEYWFFQLWNFLTWLPYGFFVAPALDRFNEAAGGNAEAAAGNAELSTSTTVLIVVYLIYAIALIGPVINVQIRRLHDTNRSGAWWFVNLVPYVGVLIMLVFMCSKPTPGPNAYGPEPYKH